MIDASASSRRAPALAVLARWLPAGAWMALILFVSSRPLPEVRALSFPGRDKLAHIGEYGVLGFLLAQAWAPRAAPGALALAVSVGLGAAFGAADETVQSAVPGRTPSLADWSADVAGLALGGLVRRRRCRGAAAAGAGA